MCIQVSADYRNPTLTSSYRYVLARIFSDKITMPAYGRGHKPMLSFFIKAYNTSGIIKRNFIYLDKISFILLHKSIGRPHLKHANLV